MGPLGVPLTTDVRSKAAYAIVGSISLIIFFTVFYQFLAATATPSNAGAIVVLGITWYALFYLLLFTLAKIVSPKIAYQFSLGLAVIYFTLDTLAPPFFVTQQGEILSTGATFTWGASDILVAEILSSFGIHGPALFWLTYTVMPIVVLFVLIPAFWSRKRIAFALVNA